MKMMFIQQDYQWPATEKPLRLYGQNTQRFNFLQNANACALASLNHAKMQCLVSKKFLNGVMAGLNMQKVH